MSRLMNGRFEGYSTKKTNREMNMCRILFILVITFISFETPRIILQIIEFLNIEEISSGSFKLGTLTKIVLHLTNLAAVSNSSINVIIYCFVGERFRKELLKWIKKAENLSAMKFLVRLLQKKKVLRQGSEQRSLSCVETQFSLLTTKSFDDETAF